MPPKKGSSKESVASNVVRFGRVKNTLRMGLVGLPNVGKPDQACTQSSLFNLLTSQAAAAENYPFCTIEPNESRCQVPDERFDYLCDVWKSPSKIPAYLQITDIAGLIKGASEGAGLGNAFLSHIQAVDGIFHIVRIFDNPDVIHVDDCVDPVRDIETINAELCSKDLTYVKAAIDAEAKAVRASGGKHKLSPVFTETMNKMVEMLENNQPIRSGEWSTEAQSLWDKREDPAAQAEWLKEVGATSALPKIIKTGFRELSLKYFFTAGEKEVRCWTFVEGTLAPQAAGIIHSDFERGFIKAEVCSFDDFKEHAAGERSMAKVKAAGKYRQEGKTYVVKDGDIIYFQFNLGKGKK
ncbi:MAG: hypothetical protein SGCHY_004375 [Lobulomycetales sp.]